VAIGDYMAKQLTTPSKHVTLEHMQELNDTSALSVEKVSHDLIF